MDEEALDPEVLLESDQQALRSEARLENSSHGQLLAGLSLESLSDAQLQGLLLAVEHDRKRLSPRDHLHDGQLRVSYARDKFGYLAQYVCLLSPRRYGKTTLCLYEAAEICLSVPWAHCVGIYPLRSEVRSNAWLFLQQLAETHKWNVKFNQNTLTCKFRDTKAVIELTGADDLRRHRQFKGQKNDFCWLDEAQDWRTDIAALIRDHVGPTLFDKEARLFMVGTPGAMPQGFFFEVCSGDHPEWTLCRGSTFENPYMADVLRRRIARLKQANPNVESEPWFRRNVFGEWVVDKRKVVIPVDPAVNYLYRWHPEDDDNYIISIDWGEHATAYTVATYNPRRYPWLIYLEAKSLSGLLIDEQATVLQNLQNKYPEGVMICDPGGMAKALKMNLEAHYGLAMISAEKRDRSAEVQTLLSWVTLGNVKIFNRDEPDAPENSELAKQWRSLMWVKNRLRGTQEESTPRDIHDAAMYARRYAHPYLYEETEAEPEVGSPQWNAIQSQLIIEKKVRSLEQRWRAFE